MSKSLTSGSLRRWLNPFSLVEKLLVLTSLGLVVMTVGSKLGPLLGLHGKPGTLVAVAVALTLDALWLGASIRTDQAIRQRNWLGATVMGGVTLVAIAASVAALAILGHAQVYAAVPVVSLAFSGLRIFSDNTLADPATMKRIASQSAADRNAAALAASDARQLLAEATTGVVLDTAEHLASLERDVARVRCLTRADVRVSKERAKAQKKLAKSEERHGRDAQLFMERRAVTPELPPAADLRDSRDVPTTQSYAGVTETVRLSELPVTEDGVPTSVPETGEQLLAMGYGTKTIRLSELPVAEDGVPVLSTPDLRDSAVTDRVTAKELLALGSGLAIVQVSDQRDSRDAGVTHSPWKSLDDLADQAGVDRLLPGATLTEDQIEVVLNWIRDVVEPDSYRKASALVRQMKFKASEKKLRLVWNHLEAVKEELIRASVSE